MYKLAYSFHFTHVITVISLALASFLSNHRRSK